MPGPYERAAYSYPSVGWVMSFNPENQRERVTRVQDDQFWTEIMEPVQNENSEPIPMTWEDYHNLDLDEYGQSGPYFKAAYGNPVVGTHIYAFDEVHVVTFVGRYTFNMTTEEENEMMFETFNTSDTEENETEEINQ